MSAEAMQRFWWQPVQDTLHTTALIRLMSPKRCSDSPTILLSNLSQQLGYHHNLGAAPPPGATKRNP